MDTQKVMNLHSGLSTSGADLRQSGCQCLDLAYVAAGRLDGVWLQGLNLCERAVGSLLIQEAGGLVSDFSGGQSFMASGELAAGGPKVFKPLIQLVQKNLA
jgi:myo-inositol-1(or 4)-monophosphatase